jgi:hypothetical protein
VRHRREAKARERDPLELAVGRVAHDLVHAPATLVVGPEQGRISVRLHGERVDHASRGLPHRDEMRLGPLEDLARHQGPAEPLQVPVGEIEVEAASGRHRILGGDGSGHGRVSSCPASTA